MSENIRGDFFDSHCITVEVTVAIFTSWDGSERAPQNGLTTTMRIAFDNVWRTSNTFTCTYLVLATMLLRFLKDWYKVVVLVENPNARFDRPSNFLSGFTPTLCKLV